MLLSQFQYKQWSDQRMLDAVQQINQIEFAEQYAFICQQLNHMIIVEDLFRARLLQQHQPHPKTNSAIVPLFEQLAPRLIQSDQDYLLYIKNTSPSQFDQPIHFTFTDQKKGSMQIQEILFHIINHGSYHRGSIARALDQAGMVHPADSYTMFLHVTQEKRREWTIA